MFMNLRSTCGEVLHYLIPMGLCLAFSGAAGAAESDVISAFETSYVPEASGEMLSRGTVVGDVDGSGMPDLAIASPHNGAGGVDGGRVYLFLDPGVDVAGEISVATAQVILTGSEGSLLGAHIHGGKDLNGDGTDELLIAAPGWNGGVGTVYLFFGRESWAGLTLDDADLTVEGDQADQMLGGGGVLLPGDINGDGRQDMILTSPGWDDNSNARDRGAVYVFLGNDFGWETRTLITADAIYRGDGNSDFLGSAAAALGDVNGDGFEDWIVSAPRRDEGGADTGTIYIFLSGTYLTGENSVALAASVRLRGDAAGDLFGSSVAGGGDLDGDGYRDILVGAPMSDFNGLDTGQVYFFPGRRTQWPFAGTAAKDAAEFSFFGTYPDDRIGDAGTLAMAEVSGDALVEAFILSRESDQAVTDGGAMYVFLGRASGWGVSNNVSVAELTLFGTAEGDRVGVTTSGGTGNLDGAGASELLVGVPGSDVVGLDSGQIYLAHDVARWFDLDGDGYTPLDGDCDDRDASANPGVEIDDRDGVDNDCDGEVDEDASTSCEQESTRMQGRGLDGAGALVGFGLAAALISLRRRMRR